MIQLKYQNVGGQVVLERELVGDELDYTSRSVISDTEVVFYYGDEPRIFEGGE